VIPNKTKKLRNRCQVKLPQYHVNFAYKHAYLFSLPYTIIDSPVYNTIKPLPSLEPSINVRGRNKIITYEVVADVSVKSI